jgi:hypothetical protein
MNPSVRTHAPTVIHDLFTKDIARPIEGVVKADDSAHVAEEVAEYVLTNEVASALSALLETYAEPVYGSGNGVWISGWFGSGKSHLLKMLAHLLGQVPGQSGVSRAWVVDQFAAKARSVDDGLLAGVLARVGQIPATALLFNIDAKAPVIDRSREDALLRVFVRVFDEARGYYGESPAVARLERDLDDHGLLGRFREAFHERTGTAWETGREQTVFVGPDITAAWEEVTGQRTEEDILARYERTYSLSIEDFANEVARWLAAQPADHRLVFLVDEVGQFIGSNTQRMLNLQSVVEQLNTKCRGRAWVCVTSQEDMEAVIGDRTKSQSYDFSKIQARFATRVNLSSRDVTEVIERRLLDKNAAARSALGRLYDVEKPRFRTLLEFPDTGPVNTVYRDAEEFIALYPFVPSQFSLFPDALIGLSKNNAFEGRHASVGERSLLSVVQEVGKEIADAPVGALVPFDRMYAGIRTSVKSQAARNIVRAEQDLPQCRERETAIRLLRALFLVKWVQGFDTTPRNLTVLLTDSFDQDTRAMSAQVQAALGLLEAHTLVQRSGDQYSYLTNEEEDIERAIRDIDVTSDEISRQLAEIITTEVIRTRTYRDPGTGRDFKYVVELDGVTRSTGQEPLAVHYISKAIGLDRGTVLAQSFDRNELRVLLAEDPRLYADLRRHVQTARYLRLVTGEDASESRQFFIQQKRRSHDALRRDLTTRVARAISEAELVIHGATIEVPASDPPTRIDQGLAQLVDRVYTQLQLIGAHQYTEKDLRTVLATDPTLVDRSSDTLQSPADEVAAHVASERRQATRVTVATLVAHFDQPPYGWPLLATVCALARLLAAGRVRLESAGRPVSRTEVAGLLLNRDQRVTTQVLEVQQVDPARVQRLRSFATRFFTSSGSDLPGDARDLAERVRELLDASVASWTVARSTGTDRYPFLVELDQPIRSLGEIAGRTASWYLEEFAADQAQDLLADKEDHVDPILGFLHDESRCAIYDDARRLLHENRESLEFLPDNEPVADLRTRLADPNIVRGRGIARLKESTEALRTILDRAVQFERDAVLATIDAVWDSVQTMEQSSSATDAGRAKASERVEHWRSQVAASASIPALRQLRSEVDEGGLALLIGVLETRRAPSPVVPVPSRPGPQPVVRPAPIVAIRDLPIPRRRLLATTQDADAYVEELRGVLHEAIEQGRRVSL